MIITVASGKGGTGKTTISLAISAYLDRRGTSVSILDCDVEEPNVNLFLKSDIKVKETVYVPIPYVNEDKCDTCGKCQEICEFSSIVLIGKNPLVFPEMCHSCGGCKLVCPNGAITEINKELGIIEDGFIGNIHYIGGKLKIGEAISPPLIRSVKKHFTDNSINIIDAPPGTSCPVVESVRDSDYVILVTEPTPFGLNDLELAVGMVREIGIPFGVVINRSDIGDARVVDFCKKEKIEILASIPNSIELARKYSAGEFVDFFLENFNDDIENILSRSYLSGASR